VVLNKDGATYNESYIFDENQYYPLFVLITKTVGDTNHHFLCVGVNTLCLDEGYVTYLSHLEFNKGIQFADATSVQIQGRVTIATGTGCDLPGAQVCLTTFDLDDNQNSLVGTPSSNCIKTDSNGRYSLPAALNSRVLPVVSYSNHTFKPTSPLYTHMDSISRKRMLKNKCIKILILST
jgi:hypothetical protein